MSNTTVVAFSAENTFFIAKKEKTERRWDTVTVIKCQIEWSYFNESEYLIFLEVTKRCFQIGVNFRLTSIEKYLMNKNQNKTSSLNIFWNSVSLLQFFESYLISTQHFSIRRPIWKGFGNFLFKKRIWNCRFEVQNKSLITRKL